MERKENLDQRRSRLIDEGTQAIESKRSTYHEAPTRALLGEAIGAMIAQGACIPLTPFCQNQIDNIVRWQTALDLLESSAGVTQPGDLEAKQQLRTQIALMITKISSPVIWRVIIPYLFDIDHFTKLIATASDTVQVEIAAEFVKALGTGVQLSQIDVFFNSYTEKEQDAGATVALELLNATRALVFQMRQLFNSAAEEGEEYVLLPRAMIVGLQSYVDRANSALGAARPDIAIAAGVLAQLPEQEADAQGGE